MSSNRVSCSVKYVWNDGVFFQMPLTIQVILILVCGEAIASHLQSVLHKLQTSGAHRYVAVINSVAWIYLCYYSCLTWWCLSDALAVWFWMMNGKETVMVCLNVLSQRFLGWAITTNEMLIRVAGPWLDSNWGPPRCKTSILSKG